MISKGQAKELMEILILVVGVVILLSISYFLFTAFSPQISSTWVNYHQYERASDATITFYYSKVSGTERTLAQLLGDRIYNDQNPVSYGSGFGTVDVDQLTSQFFNYYFEDKWRFEIKFTSAPTAKSTGMVLGNSISPNATQVQTFEFLLPIPSTKNEMWRGYLYVW